MHYESKISNFIIPMRICFYSSCVKLFVVLGVQGTVNNFLQCKGTDFSLLSLSDGSAFTAVCCNREDLGLGGSVMSLHLSGVLSPGKQSLLSLSTISPICIWWHQQSIYFRMFHFEQQHGFCTSVFSSERNFFILPHFYLPKLFLPSPYHIW